MEGRSGSDHNWIILPLGVLFLKSSEAPIHDQKCLHKISLWHCLKVMNESDYSNSKRFLSLIFISQNELYASGS